MVFFKIHPLNLPSLGHDLHQVVGQVAAGQVETQDGVGKGVTLVDGDGVGDTVSDVEDETGGTTRGVQGEDGLDGNVPAQREDMFTNIFTFSFFSS